MSFVAQCVRTDHNFKDLRDPAYQVIQRIQDVRPSDQIRAVFLAAVVMAQAVGLNPHEEVERARATLPYAWGEHGYQLAAIDDYTRNELGEAHR
ncbi:MAG: hypothetical protein ACK4UQ_06565 [Brevundimonas sp.]